MNKSKSRPIDLASLKTLKENGFIVIADQFTDEDLLSISQVLNSLNYQEKTAGLRNLLSKSPFIKELAEKAPFRTIASAILGAEAQAVRAIFFDKTENANWYVTWHQDLAIPVNEQRPELTDFGPWSIKEGIVHVQPPQAILEKMISLRLHLDDCGEENGALKFIAGSHKDGILESLAIARLKESKEITICPAKRGEIIAMRPLLLHSSSQVNTPTHRRVLHIEYASATLPQGLNWVQA